ncbi:ABC transporter periplasmic binding domain [Propionibacterium ruminifibrarum]|uniref:ABC transporter periplasmic binding domain n=1 Tax=Propionibacterium ruminifibrarum TaxID=1962131 RepID=A0A375HZS7_9ACTN|nr:ABC transporter substrate-binding protein [Propionibacterium ruminifibrarum]SPF67865.1 ABC transporter periplasmic binding domain [Propionibacterium ruminifibrarum]
MGRTISRTTRAGVVAGCFLLVLAGCSSGSEGSGDASSAASTAAGFPVTMTRCGQELSFDAPPERTVTVNQASTEIQLALGVHEHMVGTAAWSDQVLDEYADENAGIEQLAMNYPSLEAVLDKNPDLVTAAFEYTFTDEGIAGQERFAELGVPAYLPEYECTIVNNNTTGEHLAMDDIYQEIRDLAAIHGVVGRGDELVAELQARMDAAAQTARDAGSEGRSVFYWYSSNEAPYSAGGIGAPQIAADTVGVTNIYADSDQEWPQVTWEDVAAKNPDVLVLGDLKREMNSGDTADDKIAYLESNPVTAQMDAVRNRRYVIVPGSSLDPSMRTVDLTEALAGVLAESA